MLKNALSDQFTGIMPFPRAPQAFQIVELASPRGKNVNHEIDVIHEDPLAFAVSFHMQRTDAESLECFLDMVSNGLILSCRGSGADKEVIGEGTYVAQFENDRILSFLVE